MTPQDWVMAITVGISAAAIWREHRGLSTYLNVVTVLAVTYTIVGVGWLCAGWRPVPAALTLVAAAGMWLFAWAARRNQLNRKAQP